MTYVTESFGIICEVVMFKTDGEIIADNKALFCVSRQKHYDNIVASPRVLLKLNNLVTRRQIWRYVKDIGFVPWQ